jgi:hypothetical protein
MRWKIRMQDLDQALSPITGNSAVDVFGLVLAPSFLRANYSIPSFGNREFALNVLPPVPAKIPAKKSAAPGASTNFY